MDGSASLATAINNTMTDLLTNFGFQPGGGSQSVGANPLGLFTTAGPYDTSCISTTGDATLIAPQFVLMADHQPQGGGTFGGVTDNLNPYLAEPLQDVLTPSGGATDLAVGLLQTALPSTVAKPAEVLPDDYAAYIQPSVENPIYAVRADQYRQLALSDWVGTTPDAADSNESEMTLNALSASDPLVSWGTEPDSGYSYPIKNDSGNGVFVFFDVQGVPQTVLLGALHFGEVADGSTCSDLSDNMAMVNQTMAELWAQAQAQGIIPSNEPAEQLTTVDLSSFARSYSEPTILTLQQNQSTVNTTLTYTVAANQSSGVQIPDGESVQLEDISNNNAVVGSGTFADNTATITVAPGALADGENIFVAVYGGDTNLAPSSSNETGIYVSDEVASAQLNANIPALEGAQQSMVDSIVFTFNTAVNCGTNAFSISLAPNVEVNGVGTAVGTLPTLSWTAVNPNADGSSEQWIVTFSGNGVQNGSIANGVYDFSVNGYVIPSAANSGIVAQDQSYLFYRLYADINGDQTVDAADFVAMSNCFGESAGMPGYNAGFDVDGASTIDAGDFVALSNDFGITYSGFTPTLSS